MDWGRLGGGRPVAAAEHWQIGRNVTKAFTVPVSDNDITCCYIAINCHVQMALPGWRAPGRR